MITLDNPLILGYTKDGYKVSHPNIDKAELVSAEYARQLKAQRDELLEALKAAHEETKFLVSLNNASNFDSVMYVFKKRLELIEAIENCK